MGLLTPEDRARLAAERAAGRHEPRRLEVQTTDGHSFRVIDRPTAEAGVVQTIWDLSDDVRRGSRAARSTPGRGIGERGEE